MNNFFNKYLLPQLLMLGVSIVSYAQILKTQNRGNVAFISGGIDLDEANAMRFMSKDWSLSIDFSDYLTIQDKSTFQVHLRIFRLNNESIFEAIIDGPIVLGRLMPGNYGLTATSGEFTQTRYIQTYEDKTMCVVMSCAPVSITV